MSKLIKLSNFFIFSIVLLALFLSNSYTNISNSILSILPDSQNKQILQAYTKYSDSKTLFVSFEKLSKLEIKNIEKELLDIKGLHKENTVDKKALLEYQEKYQLFLKNLDEKRLESIEIKEELLKIQNSLLNSFFPVLINKQDPLNLFEKTRHGKINKNIRVYTFDKTINSLAKYKEVYSKIKTIENKYKKIKTFSTIFYFVENSQAIKDDVNKIIIFAFLILLTLYIFILRNIPLLLNTLTTLATSAIISTLVVTTIFSEVSIFVLVFGLSISTVAIDYMFHHYMHGHYVKKKEFNKEVFFGFLTTIIAFIAISFISFSLITQIAIFTIISLTTSYLHFSFLYPKIGFTLKQNKKTNNIKVKIDRFYILLFSFTAIAFSLTNISFDTNLRNLDYQNEKLDKLNFFFQKKLEQENKVALLIETTSIKDLMKKYQKIKQTIPSLDSSLDLIITKKKYEKTKELLTSEKIKELKKELELQASNLGFKKEYFKEAYTEKELPNYSFKKLKEIKINYFKYKEKNYVFLALDIKDYEKIKILEFVKPLSIKFLFENSLQKVEQKILVLGIIALVLIILMLLFITKKKFVFALTFLLFPLSLILLYSNFVAFNILHIFMMFIILAISIDYAIYSSKSLDINTKKAILYSLLSTFAGFGVLIFSKINSLYSIGIVATIGVLAIVFLLIFLKRSPNED
ncbi:hypothetical protein CP965_08205 [Halarcobacter mediterraneus]|uniref:Membrane transport protein MMPL domain-containing protein n=1 Tax=Halarcobacter mediterraneus TaxID=2023153 RepID=A0A4Q1AS93_9BACT|nr:hypothetical protein [Halarcobacter mediterraneus]RXK12553.1 hypothetical protein CP965_08205 [Halarcobacter mediterraneus]